MARPSLLAWLRALFAPAAPVLPAPVNPFARRPDDDHLVPYDPWRDDGWRADGSVYNALTQGGGPDDKGSVARPSPFVIPLDDWELTALWTNNGITNRIVSIVPQRATRRGWSVPELDGETRRLQIPSRVGAAMTWARLYGAGVGLMVTQDDVRPGLRPDEVLREPLDLQRVGRFDALQVFDPIEAQPVAYETDVRSPRFRLPLYWRFSTPEFRAVVHTSRVVHFRGSPRPPNQARRGRNGLPDDSCLQMIWDETRRLTETLQGGATLAAEIRESVFKLKNMPAKRAGDRGVTLMDRLRQIVQTKSLHGLIVLDPDDAYENRSNPPTGFAELSAAGWEALAAVTGIPQVILMGSTPGGLNTDGDSSWEGFRQLVSTYQEQNREPIEQIYAVAYAAQDGPTRGETPDRWAATFAALDEPREDRIATTRREVASMDETNIRAGVYTAEDVRHGRFGAGGWSIDLAAIPDRPATATPAALAPVGVQSLVAAGIVSAAAGRRMLGLGEDAAPSAEELAAALAAAGGGALTTDADDVPEPSPPPTPATPPRRTGAIVHAPAADLHLVDQVRAAIGQDLTVEQAPHVTVLYLGDLVDGLAALDEVAAVVAEELRSMAPGVSLRGAELRAFPHGPSGTPIVVEFADAWRLGQLHDVLLTRLAHLVTTRQHRSYRPHVTVGYAAQPVGPDAAAALLAVDLRELALPIDTVVVADSAGVLVTLQIGASPATTAPAPPLTEERLDPGDVVLEPPDPG